MQDPLAIALRDLRGSVRWNVPMRPMTHVRIGGPAQCLVAPLSEEDVALVVRVCRDLDVPMHVLGGGSNVLVADRGVRGVVVHLGALNRVVRDGTRLTAGAGVTVPSLLRGAREAGLAGLEVLTGVPAEVGGAVAMNAGTREGETFDRLHALTVVDRNAEVSVLERADFRPSYRDGGLGGRVVVDATFDLDEDDPKAIYARFESFLRYRNATQPVSERSVGCVFKNPAGESAGRLIEQAGCKLMRRGAIQVSARHANYFVNDGEGTAADFLGLIRDVRARVRDVFGTELQLEVKTWGFREEELRLAES